MKCYTVNGKGFESIVLTERPSPQILEEQDVLVEVKACCLNYRDLMIAKGEYQPIPENARPFIPLSDMAGVVVQVGPKVTDLNPGDRVLNSPFRHWPAGILKDSWAKTFIGGLNEEGVLAEHIVYPSDSLVKIPPHLNFQEASTFPIAGLTAWAAVVTHGKTRPGEWVLLHGTGGVSIFAAQLAHSMGAKTIMTTSSKEKGDFVKKKLGVHETLDYREKDWMKKVKELTGGLGVDVVVDVAGGPVLAQSLKICQYGARVAIIGVLSGQESIIQTRDLLRHQVQMQGIFMESTQELNALIKAVDVLQLKPYIDKIFPFNEVKEAYRYLADQKHIGKVVISF